MPHTRSYNNFDNAVLGAADSSEVREIISSKPDDWVWLGTWLLCTFLLLTAGIAWFISYPDMVPVTGRLTSINAPKEVRVKQSGKLIKLFKKEGDTVVKNEILGFVESTADHNEVLQLCTLLDMLDSIAATGNPGKVVGFPLPDFKNLGELQPNFQVFKLDFADFSDYSGDGLFVKKRKMLLEDIAYLLMLNKELKQQRSFLMKDLALADTTFQAYETLKNQNVLSSLDYRLEKSKLFGKKISIPQINSTIILNEAQGHDKLKEIAELDIRAKEQLEIFRQSLYTLKNHISGWCDKFILKSPEHGVVTYNIFWQENQELSSGQSFCFVVPGNSGVYAEAVIPQYNFGKVKEGQVVRVDFFAYPGYTYGTLEGRLDFIAAVPDDSGYKARITLPQKLITTGNRIIYYRPGLTFKAGIITERKNLLQRLFDNLRNNRL